jgi:serine/threonine protein phosphatase 1
MIRKEFDVNSEGRDFVVGDLHGQVHMLEQFMQWIGFNTDRDRMFSVGDLVDRGQNSLDTLMLLDKLWFHPVKSNHEQLMEDALTGGPTGSWWVPNGGSWFSQLDAIGRSDVIRLLPEVQKLPWLITVSMRDGRKFHVIHAEFGSNEELSDEMLADPVEFRRISSEQDFDGHNLLWGRFLFRELYDKDVTDRFAEIHKGWLKNNGFLKQFGPKLSHIFSGHTPVRKPTTIAGQTNLDTMAFGVGRRPWAGLTVTEPLTGKFWTVSDDIREVRPVVV